MADLVMRQVRGRTQCTQWSCSENGGILYGRISALRSLQNVYCIDTHDDTSGLCIFSAYVGQAGSQQHEMPLR